MNTIRLLAVALAFAVPSTAAAHDFHFRPALSKRPVAARAAGQRLVIRHDRAVLRATSWLRSSPPAIARFWFPAAWHARRFHAAQLAWTTRELTESRRLLDASRADRAATAARWSSATATWYGPGFYGHGPACAGYGVLTKSSWWVATVPKQCGRMFTICDGSRCVHAPGADTGGFAPGNFDLSPAVARALGGTYTHRVRWR